MVQGLSNQSGVGGNLYPIPTQLSHRHVVPIEAEVAVELMDQAFWAKSYVEKTSHLAICWGGGGGMPNSGSHSPIKHII